MKKFESSADILYKKLEAEKRINILSAEESLKITSDLHKEIYLKIKELNLKQKELETYIELKTIIF